MTRQHVHFWEVCAADMMPLARRPFATTGVDHVLAAVLYEAEHGSPPVKMDRILLADARRKFGRRKTEEVRQAALAR